MNIGDLLGKTIKTIIYDPMSQDRIVFVVSHNEQYILHHHQDCCESVIVDDICGELDWLVDSPILTAEERCNENETSDGSETWTFYELATLKGSVTIRWHGVSNGYYSESVWFERIEVSN